MLRETYTIVLNPFRIMFMLIKIISYINNIIHKTRCKNIIYNVN